MKVSRFRLVALLVLFVLQLRATPVRAAYSGPEARTGQEVPESPAEILLGSIADPQLSEILREVLDRNPDVATLEAQARAARQRPPQVKALPDPMAGVTAYLLSPETRVGPQRVMASLSQKFPWFGKLSLREQAALYDAAAVRARVEARRLEVLTEARTLYYEIAFLDSHARITREDRETLAHYEELARTRYASGVGLQQAVVKIQAEITKDDTHLLDIAKRRVNMLARLNALRDRPDDRVLGAVRLPVLGEVALDDAVLRARGISGRPEVGAADAEIARADTGVALARKDRDPDVTLGLTYALVGGREDPAGRAMPPPDNGQDVLGISAAVNLPIWRSKLAAGVEEATESRSAASERRRQVFTRIHRAVDDLVGRIPLIQEQLRLFDDVLSLQAEESLRSAESGYAAGTADALDLLDAERILLEVRTAAERTRSDYAIAVARLEGAVAGPIRPSKPGQGESP